MTLPVQHDVSEDRLSCTEDLDTHLLAPGSLSCVQRVTRTWTVAACVSNMPLPLSGSFFCRLCSTICPAAVWGDCRVVGSGMGVRVEKMEKGLRMEKARGTGKSQCCPELLWRSATAAGKAAKHNMALGFLGQKHFPASMLTFCSLTKKLGTI